MLSRPVATTVGRLPAWCTTTRTRAVPTPHRCTCEATTSRSQLDLAVILAPGDRTGEVGAGGRSQPVHQARRRSFTFSRSRRDPVIADQGGLYRVCRGLQV
jgi:hypothetical protein